jgi:hypothetical protein
MVDKYVGLIPKGSIWFRFSNSELRKFVEANPEFMPKDQQIDFDLLEEGTEFLSLDVTATEAAIARAGLSIVTLFD